METIFMYVVVLMCAFGQVELASQALDADCDSSADTCSTTNAACFGTSGSGSTTQKCLCKPGYYKVGTACVAVIGSTCTADGGDCALRGLENAACSGTTCGCRCGFTQVGALCCASGASSIIASAWTIAILCVLAAVKRN